MAEKFEKEVQEHGWTKYVFKPGVRGKGGTVTIHDPQGDPHEDPICCGDNIPVQPNISSSGGTRDCPKCKARWCKC